MLSFKEISFRRNCCFPYVKMNCCRVGVKVGVVAGAVKLSVDQDIWSLNTNKGARVYANLQEHVVPGTIVFPEKVKNFRNHPSLIFFLHFLSSP